ncbi:Protein THEMIS2 [Aix galericulata]|nr:Protein THEMIS2 [Aix galericulata]
MEPLSFQEYICSLDPTTLPRILRICSGVYFQGLFQPALDLVPSPTPQGPFPGVSGKKGLTLHQALAWRGRQTQPLRCPTIGPHALLLSPVYEVQATMNRWAQGEVLYSMRRGRAQDQSGSAPAVRRDEVKIPSTLEVDVEDVTEESQDVHFSRPLLLSEVLGMEEVLPTQAEILEGPHSATIFESAWVPRLRKGQRLQIHSCSHTWRVLASARSGIRRFLLSSAYQGRFRRRPRQFAGVQELAASLQPGQQLHVVVMQDCEGRDDDVPPLSVGDRLEARQLLLAGASTRLLCLRHSEEEGEEEEGEELLLPLDLGGSFVEEVCDSKKYRLTELVELLPLPCDVRVVATDPAMERDVLGSFPALRLEARITQPFLVSSFCEEPDKGFEIPPQWLDLSLALTEEPVHSQAPSTHCSHVEELTEAFYYKLLAQLPGGSAPPPPRPPKPKAASRDVQVQPRPVPQQDRARSRGKRSQVPRPTTSSQTRLAQPLPPPLVLPQKVKSLTTHRSTPNEYSPRPHLPAAPRSRKAPSDTGESTVPPVAIASCMYVLHVFVLLWGTAGHEVPGAVPMGT